MYLLRGQHILVSTGTGLYQMYPSVEIALWLLAPIFAAIIAWAFKCVTDNQVQERVNEILENSTRTDGTDDEQNGSN